MSKGTQTAHTDSPRNDRQQRILDGVAIWAAYYRANPHRFVEDFLHIQLHLFQKILLFMMNLCYVFVFIAARGLGKTYLSAIFCCYRCVLYPGTKICIASGTRGQSVNVLEKIITEIRPNSPELAYEIDEKNTKINSNNAQIMFLNGSFIKVVTASDSSRGNRAHILIIDEFRLVKKDVIDTILRKFLSNPRHPKYMNDLRYKHLQEPNKTIYLSSGYYKDHWSYTKAKDSCRFMLDERRHNFVCGLPYQLAMKEGMLMEETVIEQMTESDFSEIKWCMEMCAEFWGDSEDAFFGFESVSKNRKIMYPMLPDALSSKLSGNAKIRISQKVSGEKRILSADVALMASKKHRNDAAAIFINQLMPTRADRYSNNIVYTEAIEGAHTSELALRLRKYFDEYACDYLVIDCKGNGLGVYDALVQELCDPDTGEIYPALSCCNDPVMAARCTSKNAEKVIWAINGFAKFNSECAIQLREGFRSGKIRLLATEYDGEDAFNSIKGYASLSPSEKSALTLPYINTTLLINELIHLKHEDAGGLVRVSEKSGMRKDRYSSLSYNYWVSLQLERDIKKKASVDSDITGSSFMFRAPKTKQSRKGSDRL